MSRLLKKTLKFPALILARLGIVWPFVLVYARIIEEVKPQGSRGEGKPTLLALTSKRFLGDLEVLAGSGEFRVLKVPYSWKGRLLTLFYPADLSREQYFNPDANARVARARESYRAFLRAFLPRLYRRLGVDCVIGPAVHYVEDLDWGRVSEEIGVPYVVLHRENLAASSARVKFYTDRCRKLGKFQGSHIITHNEIIREIFVRSGYVAPDNITSLGCLRMDEFVRKVRAHKGGSNSRKKVVFFSFLPGTSLSGLASLWPSDRNVGLVNFFEHTHAAFGELARDHPEVDFVIKPKWSGRWVDEVEKVLRSNGIAPERCRNLSILPRGNVHELILESDVVCGYGSTTLLEAGITGKPVIVPHFEETLSPEYRDYILFQEHFHLFDIAGSPAELKSLILERLRDPAVDEACMAARRVAFEETVSSLKSDATAKYTALLKKVIEDRRSPVGSPAGA